MKIKFLFPVLVLSAMIACKQTSNNEETNTTTESQDVQKDTSVNSEEKPGVYFVNLKEGDHVKSPVYVEMGVHGKEVEPAGEFHEGKGHHHIIIDGDFIEKDSTIAKDGTHIHYGKGQTSDSLQLSSGHHTLTLQFANGLHQSYGKEWSSIISVEVE